MKRAAGRAKDLGDIEALEELRRVAKLPRGLRSRAAGSR